MQSSNEDLAAEVLEHLVSTGFTVDDGRILPPSQDKAKLRLLHAEAVRARREQARDLLQPMEAQFILELVSGGDLVIETIRPYLTPVSKSDTFNTRLFRWIGLHWSVPVSNGYGRRLRFLVRDRGNGDKLIGLIGLSDPVFSLAARDAWIGWTPEERAVGLVGVMDAYVLGAVPPYSYLAGGKLVALLALTAQVLEAHDEKYRGRRTLILGRRPSTPLSLITTTSALGRSSMYSRLTDSSLNTAYYPTGFTQGTGDFQFSPTIYERLRQAAQSVSEEGASSRHPSWEGTGYRNRRETIRRGLRALGFRPDALRIHGVRRQTFGAPLAENWRELLMGKEEVPRYRSRTSTTETEWWLKKWAMPRTLRIREYLEFLPDQYRLYPS